MDKAVSPLFERAKVVHIPTMDQAFSPLLGRQKVKIPIMDQAISHLFGRVYKI